MTRVCHGTKGRDTLLSSRFNILKLRYGHGKGGNGEDFPNDSSRPLSVVHDLIMVVIGVVPTTGHIKSVLLLMSWACQAFPTLHHGHEHMTEDPPPVFHGREELDPNTTQTYTLLSPF